MCNSFVSSLEFQMSRPITIIRLLEGQSLLVVRFLFLNSKECSFVFDEHSFAGDIRL